MGCYTLTCVVLLYLKKFDPSSEGCNNCEMTSFNFPNFSLNTHCYESYKYFYFATQSNVLQNYT